MVQAGGRASAWRSSGGRSRPAIEGRLGLHDAAREFSISSMQIVADSTWEAGDFASTLGRARWVSGPKGGSDAPTQRRRFLVVWRREPDGHWRIARELLNEDV